MKKRARAGTAKSWTCIVLLTLLLPLGAVQLSHSFFTAGAHAVTSLQVLTNDQADGGKLLVTACPDLAVSKAL